MKDIRKEIRERWFENHIATLTLQGNLQVLDWRNPKCFSYHCRYVFDREFVYISGDLGEAVFRLTWNASIHSFDGIYSGYFHQKISAFNVNEEKWAFDADKAVARLREWLKNLKEHGRKYDHDEMRQFFEEARECRSKSEWAYTINNHHDFLSELDQDLCEWMYSAGEEIPNRVLAYLIGLQMASEQIKASGILMGKGVIR